MFDDWAAAVPRDGRPPGELYHGPLPAVGALLVPSVGGGLVVAVQSADLEPVAPGGGDHHQATAARYHWLWPWPRTQAAQRNTTAATALAFLRMHQRETRGFTPRSYRQHSAPLAPGLIHYSTCRGDRCRSGPRSQTHAGRAVDSPMSGCPARPLRHLPAGAGEVARRAGIKAAVSGRSAPVAVPSPTCSAVGRDHALMFGRPRSRRPCGRRSRTRPGRGSQPRDCCSVADQPSRSLPARPRLAQLTRGRASPAALESVDHLLPVGPT